jgi:transcriptional regulator with XRE-family HTH domain
MLPKRNPHACSREHELLGDAVRDRRHRLELSQEALGFLAGLHRNYIGAIERGEINATFRTLLRLCTGLEMSIAQLMIDYEEYLRRSGESG